MPRITDDGDEATMPCLPPHRVLFLIFALANATVSMTAAQAQGLRINEIQVAGNLPPASEVEPWVEIVNIGPSELRLDEFLLRTDGRSWLLPAGVVVPGEIRIVQSPAPTVAQGKPFLGGDVTEVALVEASSGAIVDSVTLPMASLDESVGRYPDGTGRARVYSAGDITYGKPNKDIGFISKLASTTAFRPRDSSPNAIVRHGGQFWILGGWSNFGYDLWYSVADVWRSSDLKRWQLVNESPPYFQYNCFVSWRGRIWSIGAESYSSSNGVTWRQEASKPCGRAVIFRNGIVTVTGAEVATTKDGRNWTTLTSVAPWGGARAEPQLVVHRNRLWVIGGYSGYGTPGEVLYNDVWSSADGVTWEIVNAESEWSPRRWATATVYDGKIFLVGGANFVDWPEEFGNTSEVWFTSDGTSWMKLESERQWPARHAAFVTTGDQQDLAVIAGYGHGGVSRIYNDAWSLRARMYFSKSSGDLHRLSSWGRNMDGGGQRPDSFSADHQIFVLRNRDRFTADERFSVSGAGSRILVGDGHMARPVQLELRNAAEVRQPLYLYGNSTTLVRGHLPEILFQDVEAKLIVE